MYNAIYGAVIGDVIGSRYEIYATKQKDFELFPERSTFTDDSVMTVAVARALIRYHWGDALRTALIREMQALGRQYPRAGYGMNFRMWLEAEEPHSYLSYGNGSAMRVSPCGLYAGTMEEAMALAEASAAVSHDHPEGIKGAQAVAAAIFLAKTGSSREEIRDYIDAHFYPVNSYPKLDEIRKTYKFRIACQESVPEAIIAFLESESFEDAIRNAVSLGGDADTQAAIAGSIAAAYYLAQNEADDFRILTERVKTYLPGHFVESMEEFSRLVKSRDGIVL